MQSPAQQPGWRPRYSLATLFKAMLLFSVLTAILGGLIRESDENSPRVVIFIVLTIAAPIGLMIGFSAIDGLAAMIALASVEATRL